MAAEARPHRSSRSAAATRQLSGQVYEWLRDRILLREFGAGQRLLVREVARELGISVTPVRDAINLLAAEGLLSVSPRKGTIVTPFSVKDVREFYEVRLLIEPPAAELAATGLSTEELAHLEALLDELEAAPREFTDLDAYVRHLTRHADFHSRIVRGARNERMAVVHAGLARFLVVSRAVYPSGRRGQTDRPHEHRDIYQALRQRDGAAARRAVEVHLVRAAEDILRFLAQPPGTAADRPSLPTDDGDEPLIDRATVALDRMALARLDVLTGGGWRRRQEQT